MCLGAGQGTGGWQSADHAARRFDPAMVKAARSPKELRTVLVLRLRGSSIPGNELDAKAILREPHSFKKAISCYQ
jgi:hypothetical protein